MRDTQGVEIMSHSHIRGTLPQAGVISPLRFSAFIDAVGKPYLVGGWIVGRPVEAPDDSPPPGTYLNPFTGLEPKWANWFEAWLQPANFPPDLVQFISRDGTFREWDWVSVRAALGSGLPREVKKAVGALGLRRNSKVYLLRAAHVRQEIELLRCLTQIAGAFSSGEWWKLKEPTQRGNGLFYELLSMPGLPPKVPLPDFPEGDDADLPSRPKKSIPGEARENASVLVRAAFNRIFGKLDTRVSSSPDTGTGLVVNVGSVLALLYACLLTNFSKRWKKCKRRDCPNIFEARGSRKKDYCRQYCAHLENVREGRRQVKAQRQRRRKR